MTTNHQPVALPDDDDTRMIPLSRRTTLMLIGAGGLGLLPAGVAAHEAEAEAESDNLVIMTFSVVDAAGNPPPFTDSATLLYDVNEFDDEGNMIPLRAPDGHHLTWEEFSRVEGEIEVKCHDGGTRVKVELDDLIPDGLYTMWVVVFKEPGFDGTFANLIGAAPLGKNDGSENAFRASTDGEADIEALDMPDTLTMMDTSYETGACLLTDEFEVHFVGAYHWDDATHGSVVGPRQVEQFGFVFQSE